MSVPVVWCRLQIVDFSPLAALLLTYSFSVLSRYFDGLLYSGPNTPSWLRPHNCVLWSTPVEAKKEPEFPATGKKIAVF